MGPRSRNV